MNQDLFAPTTVEDHTKVNARFGDILNLNAVYDHNLYVIFAKKNLYIMES